VRHDPHARVAFCPTLKLSSRVSHIYYFFFFLRLRRKFGFRPRLKCWKATFFRTASGKVGILIVPGGKVEILRIAERVFAAQSETETSTTVLTKHKLLVKTYIQIISTCTYFLTYKIKLTYCKYIGMVSIFERGMEFYGR
jgi:hypothetical protein